MRACSYLPFICLTWELVVCVGGSLGGGWFYGERVVGFVEAGY